MAADKKSARVDHDDPARRSKSAHYLDNSKPLSKKVLALKLKKDEAASLKDDILKLEVDIHQTHAKFFLEEQNQEKGKALKSIYVKYGEKDGKGLYACISYKDMFKITHPEMLPALQKLLKDRYKKFFPDVTTIKLKPDAGVELFKILGKKAAKFLTKDVAPAPVTNFKQAISFLDEEEKDKIEEAVEQARPSFRFD